MYKKLSINPIIQSRTRYYYSRSHKLVRVHTYIMSDVFIEFAGFCNMESTAEVHLCEETKGKGKVTDYFLHEQTPDQFLVSPDALHHIHSTFSYTRQI
jgi:hypothetical protein